MVFLSHCFWNSQELLDALGVSANKVPPFIYRMRELGYPPGWLKEAEEENSGLQLYDGNGIVSFDMTIKLWLVDLKSFAVVATSAPLHLSNSKWWSYGRRKWPWAENLLWSLQAGWFPRIQCGPATPCKGCKGLRTSPVSPSLWMYFMAILEVIFEVMFRNFELFICRNTGHMAPSQCSISTWNKILQPIFPPVIQR